MMGEYRSVRALARGLEILRILSRRGPTTITQLSIATGINRTTIYRLVSTLDELGYVGMNASDNTVSLRAAANLLTEGVRVDWIRSVAYPELAALGAIVLWPVNLFMPSGDEIVLQETTHHLSPFSIHRSMVGTRWGYLNTSPGRAYLSYIDTPRLDETLELLRHSKLEGNMAAQCKGHAEKIIAKTREAGYGSSVNEAAPGISGIAVPLRLDGDVVGAINMVFFTTAMNPTEAAAKYLDAMEECAKRIGAEMSERKLRATCLPD
ncbi:UNVERIFIED_ORG: IclR family mhp operon transcriptional activator [Xanthobacter viscosus]|uniref:HTH domain-containing protein n=1 Tax=Xanthobacter autotrophicus TaxID=280 RepID=A0A6C1KB97_XANAU|nr:IclR family transcriptional regulator C-terminal domain-containing protein [Xanthobacter autotrophicus]TLX41372.1 HTH domain-containing protein [Xanthobacter autotrophicus]